MTRKRSCGFTAYEDREASGRGCGYGSDYQPWLKVSDFTNSTGMRTRLFSLRNNRIIHLFSYAEKCAFLMFDWNSEVTEIREQFPLDPFDTRRIAQELGINHPGYTRPDGCVMTTDFLVRFRERGGFIWRAYQVKSSRSDIKSPRAREKLRLEQEYWKRHRTEWTLLFSEDFNKTYCRNLDRLSVQRNRSHSCRDLEIFEDFFRGVAEELPQASSSQLASVSLETSRGAEISGWDAILALAAKKRISFPIMEMDIDSCRAGDFQHA